MGQDTRAAGETVKAALGPLDYGYVLEVVERLVSIPSVSGNEDAVSTYVAGELGRLGLSVAVQEVLPGRRNVLGTLETGRDGPTLMLNGHFDTLPIPPGWSADPFTPRRAGGRLIGAEINNMKAAVGAMIGCMAALRDHRARLKGRILFAGVIGECDALGLGATHMLRQGVSADCAINGEPTDLKVMTSHSGVTQLRLVVEGRSAHVSARQSGINAIEKMMHLLAALDEKALNFRAHPNFPSLPTLNVGTVRGGELPSMLAAQCEAEVDVRTVPGMTPESVKADIEAVIARLSAADPQLAARVELFTPPKFVQERPFHVSADEPIVRTVAAAHARLTGHPPQVGTLFPQVFYGTDSSHLLHAGIPTAIYGPGKVEDIHVPDEGIAIEDIKTAAAVYLLSALAVCAWRRPEETGGQPAPPGLRSAHEASMTQPGHAIGVDIGGTFTDVVCRGPDDRLRVVKIPTTRANPSRGVLDAVVLAEAQWSVGARDIARFVHGTTVATNAILEHKHARIGLITTAGFKDVLEIGRQKRQAVYDLVLTPETPVFLAPGERRKEVTERIAATGEVVRPLDEAGVLAAAAALAADRVEAIAIAFLFSFVNPVHERRARVLIEARYPHLMISLSSEVDPAAREYERTGVTAFDAAVKPVLDRYLASMETDLKGAGIAAPLQVMTSRGGVASAATAREKPVRLLLSGPAAGVIGGQIVGTMVGADDVITIDIGGTSCDIALVAKGQPLIRAEGMIGGHSIRVPMVDVNAIGAGGGSIAWLDSAGGLRVGPHSAGSEPGPACYGRGGTEPTVTDASVVLGYIQPDRFAGGRLRLTPDLAARAIDIVVGRPLGMTTEAAALGIHRILNAQMAEGIRLVSIRRGYDPRGFALVAGGGGGPLHACALARELAIERIVVPPFPGALSACGLLAAPVEQELSIAFSREISTLAGGDLRAALGELDSRCGAVMRGEVTRGQAVRIHHFADICYVGQGYHLEVPLQLGGAGSVIDRLYRDFLAAHDRIYGHSTRNPARIVNLRTVHRAGGAVGLGLAPDAARAPTGAERRSILLPEPWGRVDAAIHQRDHLIVGTTVDGPAIVEQADTTTLVEPGWRARAVDGGILLLDRSAEA